MLEVVMKLDNTKAHFDLQVQVSNNNLEQDIAILSLRKIRNRILKKVLN